MQPAMRLKCECEFCRSGETTHLHSDASHDQSLFSTITFNKQGVEKPFEFKLCGGSTKCARTTIKYMDTIPDVFRGKKVLEVGAGTGLVGLFIARVLEPQLMCFTDQEPMLEQLQENVEQNVPSFKDDERAGKLSIQPLFWGDKEAGEKITEKHGQFDAIVGSDLIFAHEGIAPLVASLEQLASEHTQVFVTVIRRFKWEESFFTLMARCFECENVFHEQDIDVYRYIRRKNAGAVSENSGAKSSS